MQSEKTADAVLEVHHELAFVEFAEIDLRAVRAELRGALQAAPAVGRGASEKFRRGQHDKVGRGKTETAGERPFK